MSKPQAKQPEAFYYLLQQIELATLDCSFAQSRRAVLGTFGGYSNPWNARTYYETR